MKEVPKPKVRPPSAAPKLDASKYDTHFPGSLASVIFIVDIMFQLSLFVYFSYKTMAGSSQYRFGVLAKIVKHMRLRHLDGDDHPLTLDDILDETNQLDIGSSVKNVCLDRLIRHAKPLHPTDGMLLFLLQWLQTEALQNNPKIEVSNDGNRFAFKPVFKLKDSKSLIKLLKHYDLKGLGGIMLEDIQESLPHCEKVLKHVEKKIVYITRPTDKKKILFYNDTTANITVKLWHKSKKKTIHTMYTNK